MTIDPQKLEERIDKVAAGATPISMALGGVQFDSMIQLLEFAKLMAVSGPAVPPHLRNNPGTCLAICTKALRFGFDPFSLAEHSYSMKKSQKVGDRWEDVETIAYDSFVISAIINAHAPITGRIDYEYSGEGDARKCKAFATPRGAKKALEHESPTLGEIKAGIGKNDKGKLKGSQLWEGPKADQQLSYDTRRDFCRKFFPEILLGWYDKDEFDENVRAERAQDVTPKPDIGSRLGGRNQDGFSPAHVDQLEHKSSITVGEVIGDPRSKEEVIAGPAKASEPSKRVRKAKNDAAGKSEPEIMGAADAKTQDGSAKGVPDEASEEGPPFFANEIALAARLSEEDLKDLDRTVRETAKEAKRPDALPAWEAAYNARMAILRN